MKRIPLYDDSAAIACTATPTDLTTVLESDAPITLSSGLL